MRSTKAVSKTVALELYADVVCPWCWIGDRRLFAALETVRAELPDVAFDLMWRPFQLDPTVPAEGRDWNEVVEQKFGGALRAQPMFERVASAGAGDGLQFAFDKLTRAPNTVKAHALVVHAQQAHHNPWPLVEALFAAYFQHGQDIGDDEVLVRIATECGLDEAVVRDQLAAGTHHVDVMQSQREAARLGIQGVPFLVLDGRFGVSGAQPTELFVEALRRAATE
jgi:predicted DsbA family dithiol-disulfide isomerase